MKSRLDRPLWGALAVLWTCMAAMVWASLRRTEGHLVYTLDDAYIHMAIAKHFAANGVWGVTPYAFGSSTSSPLWTGLLALVFRAIGPSELAPLALNVLFATLTLVVVSAGLRERMDDGARFGTLIAATILSRLPAIALTGMEHTLHMALTIAFVFRAARPLAAGHEPPRAGPEPGVLALAAVLPLARYEALFLVLLVALALAWRGRVRDAALIGTCALAPIAIYAAISVAHGWFPLPNSVLLKAASTSAAEWLGRVPRNLTRARVFSVVFSGGLAVLVYDLRRHRSGWTLPRVMLGVFLATSMIHLQLAQVGWLHRYEAYLVVLGVVAIALGLFAREPVTHRADAPAANVGRGLRVVRVAVVAVALVVAVRAGAAFVASPLASQNIYQQQIQMGRFIARAYPGQAVAANDIGAINFLADVRCIDLVGLASMPIARLRLDQPRTHAEDVDRVVREGGARIAVVYEPWFRNGDVAVDHVPPRWGAPVARWSIRDNVACAEDTVSFFALAPGERDSLAAKLRAFEPRLPGGVRVE